MASQDNGQASPAAVVFGQFEQSLQTGQGMTIEIMGFINEQGHGALALLYQFVQFAIPFFDLGGNAYLFLGGKVIEERGDEGGQLDVCFSMAIDLDSVTFFSSSSRCYKRRSITVLPLPITPHRAISRPSKMAPRMSLINC